MYTYILRFLIIKLHNILQFILKSKKKTKLLFKKKKISNLLSYRGILYTF